MDAARRPRKAVLLLGEDVLDMRTDGGFLGVRAGRSLRHRPALRLLAMDLGGEAVGGQEGLVGFRAVGRVRPSMARRPSIRSPEEARPAGREGPMTPCWSCPTDPRAARHPRTWPRRSPPSGESARARSRSRHGSGSRSSGSTGFLPSAAGLALVNLTVHEWPGGHSSDLRRRRGQQAAEGEASRSFCRSLAGFFCQAPGMRPALISAFSSSVLRCFAAGCGVPAAPHEGPPPARRRRFVPPSECSRHPAPPGRTVA